jgi:hypothetical protein
MSYIIFDACNLIVSTIIASKLYTRLSVNEIELFPLKNKKQTNLDDFKGKRDVYGLCDRLGNVKEPLHVFIVNTRCNRLFLLLFFYFQRPILDPYNC